MDHDPLRMHCSADELGTPATGVVPEITVWNHFVITRLKRLQCPIRRLCAWF
jgi:hypothetical protein